MSERRKMKKGSIPLLAAIGALLLVLAAGLSLPEAKALDIPNPQMPGGMVFPTVPGSVPTIEILPIITPTPTVRLPILPLDPKLPLITPEPTKLPLLPIDPKLPLITPEPTKFPLLPFDPKLPLLTPTPTLFPLLPFDPRLPIPLPTNPPSKEVKQQGQVMVSEGPPFLSFRMDLTDELYMFTPMDLSLDGEYLFPLIGNASQVVGQAKVVVQSGVVVVTYEVAQGVKVNEKEEFFTFFPDIATVPSVKPEDLQEVKFRFGLPYAVQVWLQGDARVLLYINCPVSYKTDLKGLADFSFNDPGYLQRLLALLPLMD